LIEGTVSLIAIKITRSEFDTFRDLQDKDKRRKDWHAVFSTNFSENTWPFETYGLTPEKLRKEIQAKSPILVRIAGIYIEVRPSGGRFFINREGVFLRPDDVYEQFIRWDFGKDAPRPISPLTGEAGRLQFIQWRNSRNSRLQVEEGK
jgi:hypothetical protein